MLNASNSLIIPRGIAYKLLIKGFRLFMFDGYSYRVILNPTEMTENASYFYLMPDAFVKLRSKLFDSVQLKTTFAMMGAVLGCSIAGIGLWVGYESGLPHLHQKIIFTISGAVGLMSWKYMLFDGIFSNSFNQRLKDFEDTVVNEALNRPEQS